MSCGCEHKKYFTYNKIKDLAVKMAYAENKTYFIYQVKGDYRFMEYSPDADELLQAIEFIFPV